MSAWKVAYLRLLPFQVSRYQFYRWIHFFGPRLTRSTNPPLRSLASYTTQAKGTRSTTTDDTNEESREHKIGRFLTKIMQFFSPNRILQRSALNLYHSCVDNINYSDFYKVCQLPDTFQSWFLINQLHVWMCLVRLKQEGSDGKYAYQQLVTFFWEDVESRIYSIGVSSTSAQTSELLKEFYGMTFAYDEGIMSNDRILAAALWRNLFSHTSARHDVISLVKLVEYVRMQVKYLDEIKSEHLLKNGKIEWLPLQR
ncbi:Ubiquinol-cytochrome-c reductase complex assembly factor 1 [Trichoplax sp. H2]|uniref:Ubiquinol-cytochrome c chaperone domain-containing protein n=1 Tax=Trichoplax adhaerens TaxID=10228 RepID=B3S482_TRIAD|nr:expressed hypothetical protein [Trichoplax adhaerens]EDV22409.1 expressed hypothetical protein [Trichoplax adhaerens]RDD42139.1 Ubiquinol-cytochrome-c reductase complex assembly factor 1 [Trichoplax sp. H2]|eukprot:XP_002114953.1 expressed hypothetical protein [Trichoplax adhaerens]